MKFRDDYSYYYHRFNSRALDGGTTSNLGTHDDVEDEPNCIGAIDDDPPDNLGAHHDVSTNIDCLNHQCGTVRRNYIEIFQLLPNSQYNVACACVAISNRPIEGPCSVAELNSGQEGLLIAVAMPPKETQGMEHGGTLHQGGEKGDLSIAAQPNAASKIGSASIAKAGPFAVGAAIRGHTGLPIKAINVSPPRDIPGDAVLCDAEFPLPSAAKPNDRKWWDVEAARRPVITGPKDDPFVREPQPSTMSSSNSSMGQVDMSICGIGKEDKIAKVERVDKGWYLGTHQGGQRRRLSDEQLSLHDQGEGQDCEGE
jgi:hypothetical protein